MNRADKIALVYVAAVATVLFTAAGMTIVEQQKEIDRLKKRNKLLRATNTLLYRLNRGENVKDEAIDLFIKNTEIPNDLRNL